MAGPLRRRTARQRGTRATKGRPYGAGADRGRDLASPLGGGVVRRSPARRMTEGVFRVAGRLTNEDAAVFAASSRSSLSFCIFQFRIPNSEFRIVLSPRGR